MVLYSEDRTKAFKRKATINIYENPLTLSFIHLALLKFVLSYPSFIHVGQDGIIHEQCVPKIFMKIHAE